MNSSYDYLFKVVFVGNAGVGKSSLLQRISDNTFSDMYISTIGAAFKIKAIDISGRTVRLDIWDISGQ
jgi:Ras-related protein Rab-1A